MSWLEEEKEEEEEKKNVREDGGKRTPKAEDDGETENWEAELGINPSGRGLQKWDDTTFFLSIFLCSLWQTHDLW